MPRDEQFSGDDVPQSAWLAQKEEENKDMQTAPTPADLAHMARAREALNTWLVRAVAAVTLALCAGLLYNVYRIEQPWIRIGQAWTLGVLVYLLLAGFKRNQRRKGISEPCAHFLRRQHEERRRGYLHLRRRLFLFAPGILACWWGNTSWTRGRSWDIDLSRRAFELHSGSWLFLLTVAGLVIAWIAFGKAAEKAAHDREEVLRITGAEAS